MKTIIVPSIPASKEMNHRKKAYTKGHHAGNNAEIKECGHDQFMWLNAQVAKLPNNHFAATHTPKRGDIHISQELLNLIPKPLHKKVIRQLKIHESTEHKIMYPKKE